MVTWGGCLKFFGLRKSLPLSQSNDDAEGVTRLLLNNEGISDPEGVEQT
jgi:hypothetical protein